MVARLLYGFPPVGGFGLVLATVSSVIGVAAGAIQGYFGARSISFSTGDRNLVVAAAGFIC